MRALTIATIFAIAWLPLGAQPAEIDYHGQQQPHQDGWKAPDTSPPDPGLQEGERLRDRELNLRAVEASQVIGRALVDAEGENLGSINDLVVDFDDSRIAAAVVGYGGVLGIGKTLVAVPLPFLTRETTEEGEALQMNITREKLEEAPTFRWDAEDPRELIQVAASYFKESWAGDGDDQQHVRDQKRGRPVDPESQPGAATEEGENSNADAGRPTTPARVASLFQASSLLRSHVRESTGENVGRLDDFIVDLESGRIIAGIVGYGGLLGIGKTLHAVPLEQMTLQEEGKEIQLRLTREQLLNTPRYSARDGNLDDPEWFRTLRAYFEGRDFEQTNLRPDLVPPEVRQAHQEKLQRRRQYEQERDLDQQQPHPEDPDHLPEGQQVYPSPGHKTGATFYPLPWGA
jgi:sporulation protein YlmC with PRC-barrel domain